MALFIAKYFEKIVEGISSTGQEKSLVLRGLCAIIIYYEGNSSMSFIKNFRKAETNKLCFVFDNNKHYYASNRDKIVKPKVHDTPTTIILNNCTYINNIVI